MGYALRMAGYSQLSGLQDRLEAINAQKKDDKVGLRNEAGKEFEKIINIRSSRDILEKQLKNDPKLADRLVSLATDNPEYVVKNMSRLAANPAGLKQIVAEGLQPPTAPQKQQSAPAVVTPAAPVAGLDPAVKAVGDKFKEKLGVSADSEVSRDIDGTLTKLQPFMLEALRSNPDVDPAKADVSEQNPFVKNMMDKYRNDPQYFKRFNTAFDAMSDDMKKEIGDLIKSPGAAAASAQPVVLAVADDITPQMKEKLNQIGTSRDGSLRPGFDDFMKKLDNLEGKPENIPANEALRAAFIATGRDPAKFSEAMDKLGAQADAHPGMFNHLTTFMNDHPAAATALLSTVAVGNASGGMSIDKVVEIGRDKNGNERPGFGAFMDMAVEKNSDGSPKYPALNKAFTATGNDPQKFNNMLDKFAERLDKDQNFFEHLNGFIKTGSPNVNKMLEQVAAGDVAGAEKTLTGAEGSKPSFDVDPDLIAQMIGVDPDSDNYKNFQKTEIEAFTKTMSANPALMEKVIGDGKDASAAGGKPAPNMLDTMRDMVKSDPHVFGKMDNLIHEVGMDGDQLRPGFADFIGKAVKDPSVMNAMKSAMDKGGKNGDFVKTMKEKLVEHPDLFEQLNTVMERNPKSAKKMFGQLASGNFDGGMETFSSTVRMNMVTDMICDFVGMFSPQLGNWMRAKIDGLRDSKYGAMLDQFAGKMLNKVAGEPEPENKSKTPKPDEQAKTQKSDLELQAAELKAKADIAKAELEKAKAEKELKALKGTDDPDQAVIAVANRMTAGGKSNIIGKVDQESTASRVELTASAANKDEPEREIVAAIDDEIEATTTVAYAKQIPVDINTPENRAQLIGMVSAKEFFGDVQRDANNNPAEDALGKELKVADGGNRLRDEQFSVAAQGNVAALDRDSRLDPNNKNRPVTRVGSVYSVEM